MFDPHLDAGLHYINFNYERKFVTFFLLLLYRHELVQLEIVWIWKKLIFCCVFSGSPLLCKFVAIFVVKGIESYGIEVERIQIM